MAESWAIESAQVDTPEGSGILVVFRVTGLPVEFIPAIDASRIDDEKTVDGVRLSTVGPVVGWRWDRSTGQLYRSTAESKETTPAASSIASIEADEEGWLVTIVVRLKETAQVAINNESNAGVPFDGRLYINAIDAGTVTLRGYPSSIESSNTAFNLQDGIGIGVINLSMTPSASPVGKLPGYDDGSPPLRVHCDAQAERVARTNNDTTPVTIAMSQWRNLRIGGPQFDEAVAGRQPRLRVRTVTTNPYTRFFGSTSTFGQSQSRLTLDAAAAGLNVGSGNVTFGVVAWSSQSTLAHLIGRWSGLSTQNSTKQWRLVYDPTTSPKTVRIDFARNNSVTSISTPLAGDLSERTLIMYRASTGIDAAWEVWINGELVNSGSPIPLSGNTGANKRLTIGARATDNNDPPTGWGDFLITEFPPPPPPPEPPPPPDPLEEMPGSVDQAVIYTQRLTDGQLNLVFHEMARRAMIEFGKPITQPSPATQAYGPENPAPERRLNRKPVALINLFGGANYDNDPLGRVPQWYEANTAWLKEQVLGCLNGCDDYEIMFNRPAGQYPGDIVSSGIFGDVRDQPGTPCVSAAQWTSMEETWDEFGISDHNVRGLGVWPPDERRRGWFYTGGGMSLDDDGSVTQNAGCNARIVTPLTPAFYRESVLDFWAAQDTRYRCLMLDSAIKFDGRFVQMVHSDEIREDFTLVGESISTDEAARLRAPWIALVGVPSGPWWNEGERNRGYNVQWISNWDTQPIYFGVLRGEELDLTRTTTSPSGSNNLRFGDIYTFVRKGATPVAWGGQYAKVGAAWDYGTDRIPVGRFTMLSPRNARVWR